MKLFAAGTGRACQIGRFSFLLPLLVILFAGTSSPGIRFENFTIKQGLPSNKIYFSLRDSRQFIWFATDYGLCRHDGLHFSIFQHRDGDSSSIPDDIVYFIFQLTNDKIIVLTASGGMAIYNYGTGKFSDPAVKQPWISGYDISGIFRDSKNNVWLTTNEGLIKSDNGLNFIKEYKIPDKVKGHHIPNRVNTICEDRNGVFWLGMFYRGVIIFDPIKEMYDTKSLSGIIPHVQVKAIVSTGRDDFVYIATGGEGLYRFNINNLSFKNWRHRNRDSETFPTNILTSAAIQNGSVIWFGSLEGLSEFNLTTGKIKNYSHDPEKPLSLINNIVEYVMYDNAGALWISTFGGISKLITYRERFTLLSAKKSSPSISSNKVIGIYNDEWSNIWLATSRGIDILNPGTGALAHYTIPKSHPFHENAELVRFFRDDQKNLWVGTWGGGISRTRIPASFEPGDKLKFTNFYYDSSDHNSISSNFIRSFSEDENGNLWISTWNGGINIIEANLKNSERIRFKKLTAGKDSSKSLASNYINEIIADKKGNIWMATSLGLQRYDFINKKFYLYYPEPGGVEKPINSSTQILIDSAGNIWSGSFGGLFKVSPEGGNYRISKIYKDKSRSIYSLIMDKKGVIWFAALNSEIGSYDPGTKHLRFYSMFEEVDGCDFYFGFPAKGSDGVIYFPSFSGVLYFDPEKISENTTVPPVYITGISVAGKDYDAGQDITTLKELRLPHDFVSISLKVAAINYIHTEENEYRYILDGYSKNWIELGNRSEIYLTGLSPGKYKLKILGSNNDGVWNKQPVTLSIVITPPFYRNPYFVFFISLLLTSAVVYYVMKKIKSLRVEKQQHLNFSEQLINSQEEERKRLSKELHDSLGQNLLVIKNLLYLYNSAEKKNEDDLTQISELISESIDEVKEISSNLHPHQLERLGLIRALNAMINKISRSSQIVIKFEYDDIGGRLLPEAEINIYRIVQESLNNIIKHSMASEAGVEIRLVSDRVSLLIKDNGKGIDHSDREIQSRFIEGLGLKSMKERARLINAVIAIDPGDAGGTCIKLDIPLERFSD